MSGIESRTHPPCLRKSQIMKISTILDHIDNGHMSLPEFQRWYVWNRDQVCHLFDSLYHYHPVGGLLEWLTESKSAAHCGSGQPCSRHGCSARHYLRSVSNIQPLDCGSWSSVGVFHDRTASPLPRRETNASPRLSPALRPLPQPSYTTSCVSESTSSRTNFTRLGGSIRPGHQEPREAR